MKNFPNYGFQIPDILLPAKIDTKTWAVIACDQYTQDKDYWKNAAKIADGKPSTLNLIFPEVYLGDNDAERIAKIQATMKEYIFSGLFANPAEECIYLERKTSYGRTRRGLIAAVDLDSYEWKPGSKALIRATEATVPERIPPRMKIRSGAALELPHIMLLADDKDDLLVGGAEKIAKESGEILYEGDLMQNSGSVKGWAVKGDKAEKILSDSLSALAKNGTDKDGNVFLFAVGDGNHSLATAKAVWDEHKKSLLAKNATSEELANSPVRYALVEIVNIYDNGLTFEPIHRVVFTKDGKELLDFMQKNLGGKTRELSSSEELEKSVGDKNQESARFGFIFKENGSQKYFLLETEITDLAVSRLQPALDEFISGKGIKIDYIHGSDETVKLGQRDDAAGILLPPIAKESFFATINGRGPLPRKSFSMGEASEKRFYIEARKLF